MWRDVTRYGLTTLASVSTVSISVALILFLHNRHFHPLNKMNAGVITSFALSVIVHAALCEIPHGVKVGDSPCALFMIGVSLSMSIAASGAAFVLSILVSGPLFPWPLIFLFV